MICRARAGYLPDVYWALMEQMARAVLARWHEA